MTEEQLCEAMDSERPVMAMTGLAGEIEYAKVVSVNKRRGSEPGQYEIFAELESRQAYVKKPVIYPANRIRLKESF